MTAAVCDEHNNIINTTQLNSILVSLNYCESVVIVLSVCLFTAAAIYNKRDERLARRYGRVSMVLSTSGVITGVTLIILLGVAMGMMHR